MRSALAARMYAAVQLSSQQQQMYVNIYKKKEKKMQLIIYQRFIKKMYESRAFSAEMWGKRIELDIGWMGGLLELGDLY
jgi:hypothetical protein